MSDYSYNPPEVTSIIGLVETFLLWRDMNGADRGYEIYHPSAFGKCLRLMQYQRYEARGLIKGDKDPFEGRMLRLFENGHNMHDRWRSYFEQLGVLKGVWKCTNPMCRLFNLEGCIEEDAAAKAQEILDNPKAYEPRIYGLEALTGVFKPDKCQCGCKDFKYEEVLVEDKELNFKGHCDIILCFDRFNIKMFDESALKGLNVLFDVLRLPIGDIVIDMKSVGANQWDRKIQKVGAHKYYEIQLTIYVHVLKCQFGMLWYEQKDTHDQKVFHIPRSEDWWQQIRTQALKMQAMAANEVDGKPRPLLPPPRPLSRTDMECAGYKGRNGCPYKKYCHKAGGIWDDPTLEEKRKEFYGDLL